MTIKNIIHQLTKLATHLPTGVETEVVIRVQRKAYAGLRVIADVNLEHGREYKHISLPRAFGRPKTRSEVLLSCCPGND